MRTQNCDIMQIFRIMCKGLYLEIFLIQGVMVATLGRSELAPGGVPTMNLRTTRSSRMSALSFTTIASRLAPTGVTK